MANELLAEDGRDLLTENAVILQQEFYTPFWTNTNNTLTQQDEGNLLFQDDSYISLQSYDSATWPHESDSVTIFNRDMFNMVQEDGGNLLFQDDTIIALQSFGSTVWTRADG